MGELTEASQVHTSLVLLGFDPRKNEEKYGIPFNSEMFSRGNGKGMEIVLYFFFLRLQPAKTKERFRSIWPIYDKTQSRDFKKAAFDILQSLERSGDLPPNTVRLSNLQTAGGDRFVTMLWHLSSLTLETVLRRETPNYIIPPLPLPSKAAGGEHVDLVVKAYKVHSILEARKFTTIARSSVRREEEWRAYASELQLDYEKASGELIQLKRKLDMVRQTLREESRNGRYRCVPDRDGSGGDENGGGVPQSIDILSEKAKNERTRMRDQLTSLSSTIRDHISKSTADRDLIERILEGKGHAQSSLKGEELQVAHGSSGLVSAVHQGMVSSSEAPLTPSSAAKRAMTRRGAGEAAGGRLDSNSPQGSTVSLTSLADSWRSAVEVLGHTLTASSSPGSDGARRCLLPDTLATDASAVETLVDAHQLHLQNMRELNRRLASEDLPDVARSVATLRARKPGSQPARTPSLSKPGQRSTPPPGSPAQHRAQDGSLHLVPPTPAARHAKEALLRFVPAERSEERRVGKECRSRWSPYH
eukprot:TRINITY_DN1853_c0_g1_i2.p1 TRINITY_DN1853_c0_g1~~TRINITY_DN1853_c0_g1_i2.p1  ORF type:complete len:531 (-),score=85.67 TRINITY_DN1853_c0_g1_i2:81-1673(-)